MEIDALLTRDPCTRELAGQELLTVLEERFGSRLQCFFRQQHYDGEAADLAQDTLLGVIISVRHGTQVRDLENYVWEAAWHVLHRAYRQHGKAQRHEPLETTEPADNQPDPERRLYACEMLCVCARALRHLLPAERELILRLVVNQGDRRQVCDELAISLETLRGRLYRALAKLRRLVEQELSNSL